MAKVLIADGYTREGTFKDPAENVATFKFSFRPATSEEIQEYRARPKPNGKEFAKQMRELIRNHVTGWDIEMIGLLNNDNEIAPRTDEVIKAIPFVAQEFMVNAICGYEHTEEAVADRKN